MFGYISSPVFVELSKDFAERGKNRKGKEKGRKLGRQDRQQRSLMHAPHVGFYL